MEYILKRERSVTIFLDEGWFYLTNNAAETALLRIAVGRNS